MNEVKENSGIECPGCRSPKLIFDPDNGEKVCSRCGLVISDTILNRGPEWRANTLEEAEKKRRTGIPLSYTYYDKGLHTTFRTNKDVYGKRLKPTTRWQMLRLKKHDSRTKLEEAGMRNLSIAMNELARITDILHLPNGVREKAAIIYRKSLEKDLIKGRTIASFIAASIYAACRQAGIPRTLREVTNASTRDLKEVSRIYRFLLRTMNLRMPVDYPMKYVPRISSKIEVSRDTDRLTFEILRKAQRKKALVGKDPSGIAAAALYMACKVNDEGCTQKEVAEAAGTTEVTLRNRLKDLEKVIEQKI